MGGSPVFGKTEDSFIHDQFLKGMGDEGSILGDQETVTGLEDLDGRDNILQPFQGNIRSDHPPELLFSPDLPVKRDGIGRHEDPAASAGVIGFTPLRATEFSWDLIPIRMKIAPPFAAQVQK